MAAALPHISAIFSSLYASLRRQSARVSGGVSLPFALAAAQKLYGPTFNPEITLIALSYFEDSELRELSTGVRARLANAVSKVDLDHLPRLSDFELHSNRERGLDL